MMISFILGHKIFLNCNFLNIYAVIFVLLVFFKGINSYGLYESDILCYNCSWIREIHNHVYNVEVPVPPADLACSRDICKVKEGVCVKDTVQNDGLITSVSWSCATSNEPGGCYSHEDDGKTRTICICSNWHFCNSGISLYTYYWLNVICLLLLTLF